MFKLRGYFWLVRLGISTASIRFRVEKSSNNANFINEGKKILRNQDVQLTGSGLYQAFQGISGHKFLALDKNEIRKGLRRGSGQNDSRQLDRQARAVTSLGRSMNHATLVYSELVLTRNLVTQFDSTVRLHYKEHVQSCQFYPLLLRFCSFVLFDHPARSPFSFFNQQSFASFEKVWLTFPHWHPLQFSLLLAALSLARFFETLNTKMFAKLFQTVVVASALVAGVIARPHALNRLCTYRAFLDSSYPYVSFLSGSCPW